jgi:hypothetical protein
MKKKPKFSLINGLWIGHTHDLLPKLMLVEEPLIALYSILGYAGLVGWKNEFGLGWFVPSVVIGIWK